IVASSYLSAAISVQLSQAGVNPSAIGLVHSSYYAGLVFGALTVAFIIRRLGYLSGFVVFALAFGLLTLPQAFLATPAAWMALRFGAGYCIAGIYVAIESWLLASATPQNRSLFLTAYMMVLYATQIVSQIVSAPILSHPYWPFILTPLCMLVCIVPALLSKTVAPPMEKHLRFERHSLLKIGRTLFIVAATAVAWTALPLGGVAKVICAALCVWAIVAPWQSFWRESGYGVLLCCCSGLIASACYAFAPTYALSLGYTATMFMIPIISGGMLLQWPICRFSERTSAALAIGACSSVLVFVMLLLTKEAGFFSIATVLFGVGGLSFALYPVGIISMLVSNPEKSVTVSSIALFAYGLGSVAGPAIAARVIDGHGQSALLQVVAWETAVVLLASVALFFVGQYQKVRGIRASC
ncbi:MAG: MFS transporter, partial [Pseudomonadota bacterium]